MSLKLRSVKLKTAEELQLTPLSELSQFWRTGFKNKCPSGKKPNAANEL